MARTDTGREVAISWRGHRAWAFVPDPLSTRGLALPARVIERTIGAVAQLHLCAEQMPSDYEPLARLLLRAEGVASSFIEGVTAPLADIVLAEESDLGPSPAAWVAANLNAVANAVADAHDAPLSVELLCRWHHTLMTASPTPAHYIGRLRDEQGWIGGTSPLDAALVTAPPSEVPALVRDLVDFTNRTDIDPIAQAALAHAQFEVIHPFADGNGRVGRILVSWVLTRRLGLLTPPPVSARMAADRNGYLAGLTLFRLGQDDAWVSWFADIVAGAGRAQRSLVERVDELREQWRTRLATPVDRRIRHRDAVVWQVLELVPRHLVLTTNEVAKMVGCQPRAARAVLATLVDVGILSEHVGDVPRGEGRPSRLYVSPELLGLASSTPLRRPPGV